MIKFILFVRSYFIQNVLKRRLKPRVLQMPVTGRCNSRCVTCEIWKMRDKRDMNPEYLKKVLSDHFFSKVRVVGINGGEPSLYSKIPELLQSLLVLKRLNRLHFISNGLLSERLLEMMETVMLECRPRNIRIYLTVSVDGVNEVHDRVRGVPGAFEKTLATLNKLMADRERYCDVLDVGSTISQENVAYLVETECFLSNQNISAYFHPAVPNKRLHNFEKQKFSILNDERSRLLACEYFFSRFKKGEGLKTKIRSFLTYYYLLNHGRIRRAGCNYLRSDVTITEDLHLYLCATASDEIGDLRVQTASDLLSKGAFEHQTEHTAKYCNSCVHYIIFPTMKGMYLFVDQIFRPRVWIIYKLKAIWLRLL